MKGFEITDNNLKITLSEQFEELYPNKQLPKFYWLKITGKAKVDDFGIEDESRLVISHKVFEVLSKFNLSDSEIEEVN